MSVNLKKVLNKIFEYNLAGFSVPKMEKQKVFISVTDGKKRASTYIGFGNTIQTAFYAAKAKTIKSSSVDGFTPRWVNMAFVTEETTMTIQEFYTEIRKAKKHYFRKGVAFDNLYQFAFLEQEINGAGLIKYDTTNSNPALHDHNITVFLRKKKLINNHFSFSQEHLDKVICFTTKSCFYDIQQDECYALYSDGFEQGIRITEHLDSEILQSLVEKSGKYLLSTVQENGKFIYGYFPIFDRRIPTYNVIRHCLSVMALMEIYKLTDDTIYEEAIHKTYRYVMDNCVFDIGSDTVAVVDKYNNNEIRLGGLGLLIVTIVMYSEIFDNDEDIGTAAKLGNMIAELQDENGQLTHVLSYPDLNVVDQFRTVFYSGEACYGLMKLYSKTREKRYFETVRKAFSFFIEQGYEKYYDHWLSYAVNELTQYAPEDQYFEFGLKNATNQIDFIINRETTWPAFLELLNAAHSMVEHMKETGKNDLLGKYPLDRFYEAFPARLFFQINGIFFPELAMFFQNPDRIVDGVFYRHHSFRVRDDDVAHHVIGLCHFIQNVMPRYANDTISRVRTEED